MAGTRIYIKLFGGEQDGWDASIEVAGTKAPKMFYVHRVSDTQQIKDTHDPQLKMILTQSLAILAYEYSGFEVKEGVVGGRQYRYDRCEAADKSLKDPAI